MTWRDKLRPASFRGVKFGVLGSDAEFGRRTVQHEYPGRDTPYSEDLGRKQRQFTVEAYIVGDDYMTQRDRLISACEQPGPGQLIHPYYGNKLVSCGSCRISETVSEGRIARIAISFYEAGEKIFPAASADFLSRLGIAGDGVISSTSGWFEKSFSVAKMPQQYIDRAVGQVQSLAGRLEGIRGIADTSAGFYRSAHRLGTDAVSLVATPALLGADVVGNISSISDLRFDWASISGAYGVGGSAGSYAPYTPTDAAGRVEVARPLFRFGDPSEGEAVFSPMPVGAPGTATRRRAEQNTEALVVLVRSSAIVVAAEAMGEKEYETYNDAISERRSICDEIDAIAERANDDDIYQSMQDLRAVISQAIPKPGEDLPDLIKIRNNIRRPSLVIAYDLYQRLDEEGMILGRNKVEHPGFVPAGIDLEVIRA